MDSNKGGEMRSPDTAIRTGPNARRGLIARPSTIAARRAPSMLAAVKSSRGSRASIAAARTCGADSLSCLRASSAVRIPSSALKRNASRPGASPSSCIRS